jgi:hypothetical protein
MSDLAARVDAALRVCVVDKFTAKERKHVASRLRHNARNAGRNRDTPDVKRQKFLADVEEWKQMKRCERKTGYPFPKSKREDGDYDMLSNRFYFISDRGKDIRDYLAANCPEWLK